MVNDPAKEVRSNAQKLEGLPAHFADRTLEKSYAFAQHLDTQTNILVGVSTAVFLFSLSRVLSEAAGQAPFVVLSFFAGLSSFVGLFAIHPPKFMRKRGQEESLMYHKQIIGFSSPLEYARQILAVIDDENRIIKEYATEIYNVSKYYYRPKRRLFHMARNLLILGIFLSFVTFILALL